jgi:glucose-1-phosphate thymidylyltransferase
MQSDDGTAELREEVAELAAKGLKGLVPVAGAPFLDHVIGRLAEAGCVEVILVISPDAAEMHEYAHDASARLGVAVGYAVQKQPLGTADAVLAAEDAVGDEPFLLCNCDNLYPASVLRQMASLAGGNAVAAFDRDALAGNSNFGAERVRSFSVVVADNDQRLSEIVEKPSDPEKYKRDGKLWLNMNLYRFTPDVFGACREVKPHPERGEIELTAAVNNMAAKRDIDFKVVRSTGPVFDLTSREDIKTVGEAVKFKKE